MARRDKLKNMKMPAFEEEELDLASLEMPEEDEMDMEEDMMDEEPAMDMDEDEAVKYLEDMGYTVTPPAEEDEDEEEDDFEEGQEAGMITGSN